MNHKTYIDKKALVEKLQKEIEQYELENDMSTKSLKDKFSMHIDNIIPGFCFLDSFEIKPGNKLRLIVSVKFLNNVIYTFEKDFLLSKPIDEIIELSLEEIEYNVNTYYLYHNLLQDFENIVLYRNNKNLVNKLFCKEHKKYKSLSIMIDLDNNTVEFHRSYEYNEIKTHITHTLVVNEMSLLGNRAIGLLKEIEKEINKIKKLTMTLV